MPVKTQPITIIDQPPRLAERWAARSELVSGAILLIGSVLALAFALTFVPSGTHAQAVAWAFVVAGVIAALRKWA